MKGIEKTLKRMEYVFLSGSMISIAFILFINVVLRKFFNSSFSWAEELSRYIMVYITFIGASVCIYKGGNISIDAILSYISKKSANKLNVFTSAVCSAFSVILTILSADITIQVFKNKQVTPALGIPMYSIYAAMLLGSILMFLRYSQKLKIEIKQLRKGNV